jgi:undecaprenyl-diphosphatase
VRLLLLLLALLGVFAGQPAVRAAEPASAAPAAELSIRDALVLGFVEGITEFLPVSSTGHLIIANQLLGLNSEANLVDAAGRTIWYKRPTEQQPMGVPMTVKLAADSYVVIIQFGAIAAVALLYWREFRSMARGLSGTDPVGLRLVKNLLIAFLPAAVVGLLLHDWIEQHLFSIGAVVAAQVAGAIFMLYAERRQLRRVAKGGGRRQLTDLGPRDAAMIGALQCVSLWPGTSRSMMAIVGGYFADLEARQAAEFSFLLGFITLAAATAYKSLQSGPAMIAAFGWSHVLLGALVAAVAAALAVRGLVGFLNKFGLGLFAVYRLILALVLAIWFLI